MIPKKDKKPLLYKAVQELTEETKRLNGQLDHHNALMNAIRRILSEVARKLDEVEFDD